MKNTLSTACLMAWVLVVLGGCLESETRLFVKRDGSGTLTRTVVLGERAIAMGMVQPPAAVEEQGLRVEAQNMGEGVTFKKLEDFKAEGGRTGRRAVFEFTDITKVGVDMPRPPEASAAEQIRFRFTKGPPATLTIVFPPGPAASGKKPARAERPASEAEMEQMRTAFDGFQLDIVLEVDGSITKTNAAYVNAKKNGLTLVALKLGELVKDEKALKSLGQLGHAMPALAEARKVPDLASYIQSQPADEVTVEFK